VSWFEFMLLLVWIGAVVAGVSTIVRRR